ncbi:hypothetical protein Dsin_027484 [Dipteronia sinensis]|uniref:Uncharacterized protein n=1 Tax=Dipteronia sinensis TaxID=43782 RepID=A0AAD9ZNV1_9ROSI|nr:hypothetical protein Dsin_027484 [Dipteronia sinensis]
MLAVWGCEGLKQVRGSCSFMKGFRWKHNDQFLEFFISCINGLQAEELALLCVVLWRVWYSRNQVVHTKRKCNMEDMVCWSDVFLSEFQTVSASSLCMISHFSRIHVDGYHHM